MFFRQLSLGVVQPFFPAGGTFTINGKLALTVNDDVTNDITDVVTITHTSTDTVANGFGSGILFVLEDEDGESENAARISSIWTDATTAEAEDAAITFQTMIAGADPAEVLRLTQHILPATSCFLGFGTTAPTHRITFASGLDGLIAAYNTADQTTNYERFLMGWGITTANVFTIRTQNNAAGTARSIELLQAGGSGLRMGDGTTTILGSGGGMYNFAPIGDGVGITLTGKIAATTTNFGFRSTNDAGGSKFSAASGTQTWAQFDSTVNQSGTAGYTAVKVNFTETSVGSGTKLLLDLQRSSTTVFNVSSSGAVSIVPIATTTFISSLTATPGNMTALANTTGYTEFNLNFAHTVQYTGGAATVADFWGVKISAPTLDAVTGGFTVTNASSLYISNAPIDGGANIALTNRYAIFVDAGICRFDGDGTHIFEIDADTTAPGAATGRIPFKDTSTGGTRYLVVADT